jgi:hypothetical protein
MSGTSEHRLVDVALTRQLAGIASAWPELRLPASDSLHGGSWYGMDEEESRVYAESVRAVIDALGVLTVAAASAWQRRFELAVAAPSPPPEPEDSQRRAADEHLNRLVGELSEAADRKARGVLLDRLNGALVVYVRSGLLDAAGVAALDRAVEEALGRPTEQFELERYGLEEDFLADDPVEAETELGPPLRLCPARPERHDGLLVTACVLYEDGFELLWHRLDEPGSGERRELFDEGGFEAVDDLDGVYSARPTGSSSWDDREGVSAVIGSATCRRPVSVQARELRVSRNGGEWLIPLA